MTIAKEGATYQCKTVADFAEVGRRGAAFHFALRRAILLPCSWWRCQRCEFQEGLGNRLPADKTDVTTGAGQHTGVDVHEKGQVLGLRGKLIEANFNGLVIKGAGAEWAA